MTDHKSTISFAVVAMMLVATTSIVGGDTAGKLLTGGGESPFFVAWSRFALGAALILPLSGMTLSEWPQLLNWRILMRAMLIVCGISCILTALRTEPIANVFGGFFIGPVVAYVLSVVILKERVSPARTVLLLIGFAGVLIVVRPGAGMGLGMFWAVAAGTCYGCYLVVTRWLAVAFRPRFLLTSQLLIGAIVLTPLGLPDWPASGDSTLWLLVLASAVLSAAGNYLITVVNRTVPASVSAPLVYFQLVAAAVFGVLVFGDWPDTLSLIGLVVILSSGLGGFVLALRQR
jgi:drug/metabolite transporter (DMT)-like permease